MILKPIGSANMIDANIVALIGSISKTIPAMNASIFWIPLKKDNAGIIPLKKAKSIKQSQILKGRLVDSLIITKSWIKKSKIGQNANSQKTEKIAHAAVVVI